MTSTDVEAETSIVVLSVCSDPHYSYFLVFILGVFVMG